MHKEELRWRSVRKRNLRISIVKGLVAEQWGTERVFSRAELSQVFCFKVSDFAYFAKDFFHNSSEKYILSEEEKKYIDKILEAHNIAVPYLKDADTRFLTEYGSYHDEYENSHGRFSHEKYKAIEKKIAELLPVLHWGHLPIFSKYLLYNRRIEPEQQLFEFYAHIHCLNAMLDEIRGKGQKMQIESDNTLGKELIFEVYTRRWGYTDQYGMRRTIDGWECDYEKCKKNGEGALFEKLKHDSVFFPEEGVKYAMEELWEAADEGEIDLKELQARLQQVADWISYVERAVGDKQPEWVNYY